MKTILVVDDSSVMRSMTKQTLEKQYNIIEACNGKDALNEIQKPSTQIDLILSDVNMPIMNGIEFLKTIKKSKFSIPLFFLSSEDENEFKKDCLDFGALGWIQKPYKPKNLLNIINSFFEA